MPSFVFGVPMHPLVVHATVVLLPVASLAVLLVALVPRLRQRYAVPTAVLAVLALVSVPVASSSGESLQARLPRDPLIRHHVEVAGRVLPVTALLVLAALLLVVVQRRQRSLVRADGPGTEATQPGWLRPVAVVATVLGVLAAVATSAVVVQVGHAGARAAYQQVPHQPLPGRGGEGDG